MIKKTIIVTILLFSLLISNVIADHTLSFDNYLDVNETSKLELIQSNGLNETAILSISDELIIMNKTPDNHHFVYVTSTKEEDVPFSINIFRSNQTFFNETFGDLSGESYIELSNNGYAYVSKYHNESVIKDSYENSLLCPLMYAYKGTPILKGFVAVNVSGNLTYYYGSSQILTGDDYQSQCISVEFQYPENMTNFTNYYGAYCTNCGVIVKIRGSVDTNSTYNNKSFTSINSTSPLIPYETGNFRGTFLYVQTDIFESYTDTLKFRLPYYINISLQETDINSTFNTDFNYLILSESEITNNLDQTGQQIGDSLDTITKIISFGSITGLSSSSMDTTEVFWCKLNNYNCQVKLYELGNYSIKLLTMKTFKEGWNYEFIKPQYTDSKIETTIDSNLELTNKTNTNVKILMSEYESNKAGFIFNIVKWVFVLIILVGGFVLLATSGNVKYIGALIPLWLILIKLLGLV